MMLLIDFGAVNMPSKHALKKTDFSYDIRDLGMIAIRALTGKSP